MTVFRYKEESLGSHQGTIKRPVADVFLKSSTDNWIEYHPYIDSGADITMVPLSLGKLLGFHLDENQVQQIGGIRGSVPVIYVKNTMKIGSLEFPVQISWALIEDVPPLLGRADVFDHFEVTFKQPQNVIEFHPLF